MQCTNSLSALYIFVPCSRFKFNVKIYKLDPDRCVQRVVSGKPEKNICWFVTLPYHSRQMTNQQITTCTWFLLLFQTSKLRLSVKITIVLKLLHLIKWLFVCSFSIVRNYSTDCKKQFSLKKLQKRAHAFLLLSWLNFDNQHWKNRLY